MQTSTRTPTAAEPLAIRVNDIHRWAPWGRSTTYKLLREGRLPARRLGSSTFVMREDLIAFIVSLPGATDASVSS